MRGSTVVDPADPLPFSQAEPRLARPRPAPTAGARAPSGGGPPYGEARGPRRASRARGVPSAAPFPAPPPAPPPASAPVATRAPAPAPAPAGLPRADDPGAATLLEGVEGPAPADLLAVLLAGAGGPAPSRERAARVLLAFSSLRSLASATPTELVRAGGLTQEGADVLAAAFALGRRALGEPLRRGRPLRASGEIFEAYHARLRDLRKERFLAVHLDGRNRVVREDVVSEGILTASLVHPREVFGPAIREHAGALLLVHNHPSGDPEPSPEDLEVTRRLCAVGELVGIRILDHVVIGDGRYVSFLERGIL